MRRFVLPQLLTAFLAGLSWLALAGPAEARRVALVIGNSAYSVAPLQNAGHDADRVAKAFEGLGFDQVVVKHDLGTQDMRGALSAFGALASGAEVAVVFYAGHGTEMAGRNYLIPTDAKLARAADVELEAVSLDSVLGQLEGVARLRLVILDACRNNVFPMAGSKRAQTRGLARVEPEDNTLVAYAAKDGTTADDGDTGNSPFTQALLSHLSTPGLDVRLLFGRVRDDVMRATNKQQQPHLYGTLGGQEIVLAPGALGQAPPSGQAVALLAPAAPPTPPPAVVPPSRGASAPMLRCDELAAHPRDPEAKTAGVDWEALDIQAGTSACREALAAYPNTPRFMFQLARVLDAAQQSDSEMVSLYRRAAEMGYAMALHNLGNLYLEGRGVAKDEAEGARLVRRAADEFKLTHAIYSLANLYENGQGVPKDLSEATRLYRRAAELKHADAITSIGIMYANGNGVPKDDAEAFRQYRIAAEGGSLAGTYNLGIAYENGTGTTKDVAEAIKQYRRAAEKGYADALLALSFFYRDGTGGVGKDPAEALRLQKLAVDKGSVSARSALAYLNENGIGTKKDIAEAARLYRSAAEKGDTEAAYESSRLTEEGKGTPRDVEAAVNLYYQALLGGHELAYTEMDSNADAWSAEFRRKLQEKLVAEGKFSGPANGRATAAFKAALKKMKAELN